MTNLEVANTILAQLGGGRFIAMTGSKDFVGSEDSLSFKLGRISNGISHVCITLDVNDTYRMEFRKWNAKRLDYKIVATYSNVYFDTLQFIFTQETGLYTRL